MSKSTIDDVLAGRAKYTIITGDVLETLRLMPASSADCSFFDPPYGLGSTDPAPEDIASFVAGGALEHNGDFMGRDWQIPSIHVWREVARVLKPGAFSCFYGGTQTDDLLSIGARMAGLSRADAIAVMGHARFSWVQSQGMPKHGNLGAQVDDAAGAERAVVGTQTLTGRAAQDWSEKGGTYTAGAPSSAGAVKEIDITTSATEYGARWEGWHGGLAPKYEPLLMFQKPFAKVTSDELHTATGWDHWHITHRLRKPHHRAEAAAKFGVTIPDHGEALVVVRKALHTGAESWTALRWRPAKDSAWTTLAETPHEAYRRWTTSGAVPNLLVHGVGALNIDATRVGSDTSRGDRYNGKGPGGSSFVEHEKDMSEPWSVKPGRFAPNVAIVHHPRCRRIGERDVRGSNGTRGSDSGNTMYAGGRVLGRQTTGQAIGYASADGTETVQASLCLAACRDADCAGEVLHTSGSAPPACPECGGGMVWCCAAAALDEQSAAGGMHSAGSARRGAVQDNGRENLYGMSGPRDVFRVADAGASGSAASRFYPQFWPSDEPAMGYAAKAPQAERDAGLGGEKNPGICRKPIRFGRRQVRQIAPPGGVVLIPYCGTGSEVIAALLEGYRVIGIERNPVDANVARRQAEHVLMHGDAWVKAPTVADHAADAAPVATASPVPRKGRRVRQIDIQPSLLDALGPDPALTRDGQ